MNGASAVLPPKATMLTTRSTVRAAALALERLAFDADRRAEHAPHRERHDGAPGKQRMAELEHERVVGRRVPVILDGRAEDAHVGASVDVQAAPASPTKIDTAAMDQRGRSENVAHAIAVRYRDAATAT